MVESSCLDGSDGDYQLKRIFIVPNILWLRNSKPHYLFADNEVYCF
jgi:hypothetical protein